MGQGSRSKEALRVLSRWTQQHDRLLAANRAQVSSPFTLWRFQQAMAIYVITAQDPLQLCSKSWASLPTEGGKREMRPLSHARERLKPPPAVMVVEKGIEIWSERLAQHRPGMPGGPPLWRMLVTADKSV